MTTKMNETKMVLVLPDELPEIWQKRADAMDGHGVNAERANMLRNCVTELNLALTYTRNNHVTAYQVGVYFDGRAEPYYYRCIRYKAAADACVNQWRKEQPGVSVKVVPLYKAVVSARMTPIHQIAMFNSSLGIQWIDCSQSVYDETKDLQCRRIVWQPS